MAKKIVIIGAGIAGLSAGCYARMNGYEAEIYEMHDKTGGLCTAWKRKGYTIDGCIHWLTGSSPEYSFYKVWEELGAVQGRRMINNDIFTRFNSADGRTFTVYADADKLEKHMIEISPADTKQIKLLCRLIRHLIKYQIPVGKPFELYTLFNYIPLIAKMIPYAKDLTYCNGRTIEEFASGFQDSFLRESMPKILGIKDYPLLSLVITLALLHIKAGGFPERGSLEFAKSIEKRFVDLGGVINIKKKVTKIIEENSRAVGIRLEDEQEIRADYVISAADLRTTLYEMLDAKHIDPMHEELFRTCELAPSSVQVSFGINMDLSSQPGVLSEWFQLEHPVTVGNKTYDWMSVKNYCYDKTLAPEGKSIVVCHFVVDDFEYWEKLYQNRDAYKLEKEKIVSAVLERLDLLIPGLQSSVEVSDVATPMTYVRYTGNWKGTYMTWIITPDKVNRFRTVKKTVPGLDNFWLSGMWVQPPGGVPTGVMTSRDIMQIICRKDKKRFQTSIPEM